MISEDKPHMVEATWQDFLDSGLLWFVNRLLHVFRWTIVYQVDKNDVIIRVWPSRTPWKGFSEKMEREGYKKVDAHLKEMFR